MCPISPHSEDEDEDCDGAAAVVVKKRIWRDREQLNVYFMNTEILEGWRIGVTPEKILEWASVWKRDPDPDPNSKDSKDSKVPKFKRTTRIRAADIRVDFSGNM